MLLKHGFFFVPFPIIRHIQPVQDPLSNLRIYPFDQPTVKSLSFNEFITHYRTTLNRLFNERSNIEELSLHRGLPPFIMRDFMECAPLSVFIPKTYDGRGGNVAEALSVLEATSYESLPLSLLVGINGALFLQPLSIYGPESVQKSVFERFIKQKNMGGLMITEPDYGSDALKMQTSYTVNEDHFHLEGTKHWAGLTGWADFWLLTARKRNADGTLARDIDFFIHDASLKGVEVEEVYQNLGLYMLPYGKNKIDAKIPLDYKLQPKTTGVTMMLDILHRSRLQFPGMGMGFLKRMMDEGLDHCKTRFVGGSSLFTYDQVKKRLARLQAQFTVCSAMCAYTTENAPMTKDVSRMDVEANSIKTVLTDYMQEAAQSLLQLVGAKGYRLDHIAGRAVVDSRPFQIFEGSNDILYQQISESVLKTMRKVQSVNLYDYLVSLDITSQAAERLKPILDFNVELKIAQRKLVELGQVIGRIVSLEMVIRLGERGFRSDLIHNCILELESEIHNLMGSYKLQALPDVVDGYQDDSSWQSYIRA